MAVATSLVLSILCDVNLHLGHGWARRVSEGLIGAVAGAVSMFICIQLLSISSATGQVWPPLPHVVSSGLGFVGGFFAPYLYRRARDEEPTAETGPSQAIPETGKPA